MSDGIEGAIGTNGRPANDRPEDIEAVKDTLRRFLIFFCAQVERCRTEDHSDPYAAGVRDVIWDLGYWVFDVEDNFDAKVAELFGDQVPDLVGKISSPERLYEWLRETVTTEDFTAVSDYAVREIAKRVDVEIEERP